MRIYKVKNPVIIKGEIHKKGELIKVNSTSIAAKYDVLEKTEILTPSSFCTWCTKAGRPGNKYWLNFRDRYICAVCYPPESFPRNDISRVVYDRFELERPEPEGTGIQNKGGSNEKEQV